MTTRKELIEALRLRYRRAAYSDRITILDERALVNGDQETLLFGGEDAVLP